MQTMMTRKEWQNLHDELKNLNEGFSMKLLAKQDARGKKAIAEIEEGLSTLMHTAYSRITSSEDTYNLMVYDLRDDAAISCRLEQLTDVEKFTTALCNYLARVEKRF